jgi:hypothetical protein
MKVLDSQGIKYFTDAKGKPFTTRVAIEGALGSENIVPSTVSESPAESATSLS